MLATFRVAEGLLELYVTAGLVLTPRLHAAIPCIAIDTPVVLVTSGLDERFRGMSVVMNTLIYGRKKVAVAIRMVHGTIVNPCCQKQEIVRLLLNKISLFLGRDVSPGAH
jgi:hypothetical protein